MDFKKFVANNRFSNQELCRMSWFLVEVDEGLRDGLDANGRIVHCIIHSVDLIDSDSTNMYLDRGVKFKINNTTIEGKMLLASDDRGIVEERLRELTEEAEMQLGESTKFFLVQYNKGCNNIIHSVVKERDICWPTGDLLHQQKVMIKDGKLQRLGRILFSSELNEIAQEELQRLKNQCFEAVFDDKDNEITVNPELWFLVQYSCSPNDVIYAIISQTETIWQEENLYPDVVAYITDGVNVYQSIILRKTLDRCDLEIDLERIREVAHSYALEGYGASGIQADDAMSATSTISSLDESEEEEYGGSSVNSKDVLDNLEHQMKREAAMIANAFESIDRVRRTMERRLYILNNP